MALLKWTSGTPTQEQNKHYVDKYNDMFKIFKEIIVRQHRTDGTVQYCKGIKQICIQLVFPYYERLNPKIERETSEW
jgi:hypothetical protein